MNLADVWLKIANNAQLTPQEKDFLARQGRETQQRNSFIAGNTTADGKLSVTFPFVLFYNEKLATDKADITIPIPSGYNHLMILSSAQTTDGSSRSLWAQVNGDTGNNYAVQSNFFTTSTIYTSSAPTNHLLVGYAVATTSTNYSAMGVAYLNNYGSTWNKTCNVSIGVAGAAAQVSSYGSSSWINTASISSLRIFPETGNLSVNSILSVYGIL